MVAERGQVMGETTPARTECCAMMDRAAPAGPNGRNLLPNNRPIYHSADQAPAEQGTADNIWKENEGISAGRCQIADTEAEW